MDAIYHSIFYINKPNLDNTILKKSDDCRINQKLISSESELEKEFDCTQNTSNFLEQSRVRFVIKWKKRNKIGLFKVRLDHLDINNFEIVRVADLVVSLRGVEKKLNERKTIKKTFPWKNIEKYAPQKHLKAFESLKISQKPACGHIIT